MTPAILKNRAWTIAAALAFARRLEKVVASIGWHVAIGGGVMLRGRSKHDLDLIAYPHDSNRNDWRALRDALSAAGGRMTHSVSIMHKRWETIGSRDRKHVTAWRFAGRRVDIISPSLSSKEHP